MFQWKQLANSEGSFHDRKTFYIHRNDIKTPHSAPSLMAKDQRFYSRMILFKCSDVGCCYASQRVCLGYLLVRIWCNQWARKMSPMVTLPLIAEPPHPCLPLPHPHPPSSPQLSVSPTLLHEPNARVLCANSCRHRGCAEPSLYLQETDMSDHLLRELARLRRAGSGRRPAALFFLVIRVQTTTDKDTVCYSNVL